MTTYTNPFTGATINPSQVGYSALTLSANTTLQWPINGNNGAIATNIIEVTATVGGLSLALPSAQQVSVGQAIIVKNVGTGGNFAFTLTDNSGNTVISIPVAPTSATVNTYYVYLINNLSNAGIWGVIAMGIGVSSAAASSLAGFGLKAIGATLNEVTQPYIVSSNYSFQNSDQASLYIWSGGAGTLTLPAVGNVPAGWFVFVKNNGSGIVTTSTQGGSTFDLTVSTTNQIQLGASVCYATDGTNWYTFGLSIPSTFNYTQLAISLTGLGTPQTLTSVQATSVVQNYSGVLTANMTIILPQTVQIYSIQNTTTGAFTLTFKTTYAGGASLNVPQNGTLIAICDGKNVYSAQSSSGSTTLAFLQLGNGSSGSPSLYFNNDSASGLYSPASGQIGFDISGAQAMNLSSSGLTVFNGISAGTF